MVFIFTFNGYVTGATRRLPLVEQNLATLLEYLSSPSVFSEVRVTRSLVFYVVFCRSLFFCPFLDHCVVCLSPIYRFWLPPFSIFWSLCCLSSCDLQILITSFGIVKILANVHCNNYFLSLFICPLRYLSFDLRIFITPWELQIFNREHSLQQVLSIGLNKLA